MRKFLKDISIVFHRELNILATNSSKTSLNTTGWLRLVRSLKLQVSFTEYSIFFGALLPKRDTIFSINQRQTLKKQVCILQGGEDSKDPLSLQVVFRKSDLYLVALLWKMICNLGDPMSLRHFVPTKCFVSTTTNSIRIGILCQLDSTENPRSLEKHPTLP